MSNKTNGKTRNTVGIGLIYLILFAVFNMLVFLIFKERNNVFWLSYAFMALAFVVQIVSMFLSFKSADVETAFFGIPLASFSVYYLIASLVIGALFMIFQAHVNFTLALVIQVLVLAAFLIIAIISLLSRDTVQEISDNIKVNAANLKSVLVDVEMMRDECTDPELKASLRRLAETVKYSDPMTNDAVADVEQRIMRTISEMRISIDDGQIADAKQACSQLERLFVERNKKLAISK